MTFVTEDTASAASPPSRGLARHRASGYVRFISFVPLLRQITMFAELDDTPLGESDDRCVARSVSAEHVLFTTGRPCWGLYMTESGRVRIYRTNPAGKAQR